MSGRVKSMMKKVEVRGILSIRDLNALESVGIDLSKHIDRDEVSKGNVSHEKFMLALEKHKRELGIISAFVGD